MAKLCKIRVNEFAIGFGPTIWKKETEQTKYALRLIPLGGFVSLEGEEEASDKEGSFRNASIGKRMAVIIAGATVNIVFGVVVFFGLQAIVANNMSTTIQELVPNYSAQIAGIQIGDTIVKVNDIKIKTTTQINEILEETNGKAVTITILRDKKEQEIILTPTAIQYPNTGIYLKAQQGKGTTKILTLDKDAAADKAGLMANDVIVQVNGQEVENNSDALVSIINNSQGEELAFTVKRGSQILDIVVKPDMVSQYYLGVYFAPAEKNLQNNLYYAAIDTKDFLFSIFENLKQLFTGKVSLNQMMGPVGISEAVSQTSGWEDFIYLLALISLSLGVTNLLPILPLDGGKFVLLVIEAIRKKPLEEKTEMALQMIGFIFFIGLFIYITTNDIARLF